LSDAKPSWRKRFIAPLGEAKSIAPLGEADGAIKRLRPTSFHSPPGTCPTVNDSLSAGTVNEQLPTGAAAGAGCRG
jgi:hypothetical protein